MNTLSAEPAASLRRPVLYARRAAQRRALSILLLSVVPLALSAALFAWTLAKLPAALAVLALAAIAAAVFGWREARRYDLAWLARSLDNGSVSLEDSSALALSDAAAATALQRLQQVRVRERLAAQIESTLPELLPRYPSRRLLWILLVALLLAAFALLLPMLQAHRSHSAATAAPATEAGTRIEADISITPPDYTGLGEQHADTLDVRAPIDSRVQWSLKLDHEASAATLVFQDGTRLALSHDGEHWRGERMLSASTLYRVELQGAKLAMDRASRFDAIADQPPEITVRTPEKTLNLLAAGQKDWSLAFDARDDYGLGEAWLQVTLVQGSGDNVKTSEQKIVLEGHGDARRRSYARKLDLTALGFSKGDDLIVRVNVADNHPQPPNISSSASFILRWPPEASTESDGMEGAVQKALPAYFRSERQIIIDTEALQGQRATMEPKPFARQSDDLGVDQKVLRLRYGQFLGEEFESGADKAPKPEGAKDAVPAGGAASLKGVPDDGDHGPSAGTRLGRSEDVLHEFGHAHDSPEATTLLDPETRRILKSALDQMWQAELNLRQAQPDLALPYEYKALEYIKQVQQAERIYLARQGQELPRVDAARRLSGKRENLSDRVQGLPPSVPAVSPIPGLWSALEHGAPIDTAALGNWIKANPATVPDALGLLADADRVQREPDCADCRVALKNRLWPLLPLPPTAVRPRPTPDAAGAAYLDALQAAGSAP